ncbi:Cytokine receptor-like factor 2 [Willisornis vidua]|uniref:Cytokine receptor-like factor 2 n=1 Tax=Willisornis vidua TaxID=1566151 RepID=A0ABQ9DKZ4_9PASS|nr:Cytokine receptor-like factor 2 [Willisornis vidua]
MRLIFQACSMIFTLGNLVASQPQSSEDKSDSACRSIARCILERKPKTLSVKGWKDAINTKIINFNNEKMQITWAAREHFHNENVSFSYTFDEGKRKVWKPCPTYLLDQDYISGCLFKTEGPTLAISIRNSNGSEELFSKELKSDYYIKPNKPENVTFFWKDDTVTVTCNKPERAVMCLLLELQYKSTFDKEWQHVCIISAKHKTLPTRLYQTYDTPKHPVSKMLQMSVMPSIPDPKYVFVDLLNDHNGNFQEWLDKTDRVVLQTKLEYEEPECITEAESQQEDEKNSGKQGPSGKVFTFSRTAENNDLKEPQTACMIPASNTMASFAGFHILMNDDMPVTMHVIVVTQVQDLVLGLVEPHTTGLNLLIQYLRIPLQRLPILQQIDVPTQLAVICTLTKSALHPLVQIINKDTKQD